jgi:hypothetical protein
MSSWVPVFHVLPFLRFAKGTPLRSAPLSSTIKIAAPRKEKSALAFRGGKFQHPEMLKFAGDISKKI